MDRKQNIESNYPREPREVVPEPVHAHTSIMTPLVVAGMMIGIWSKFSHRGSFWGVFAALGLIFVWMVYKIVWLEKQFFVQVSKKDKIPAEISPSVNESEGN